MSGIDLITGCGMLGWILPELAGLCGAQKVNIPYGINIFSCVGFMLIAAHFVF